MKTKIFFGLLLLLCTQVKAQNLLVNPGFENALSTGWTISTGNWSQFNEFYGYGPPNSGTYYTSQGFGPNGTIYQDVDVSGYATQIDNGTQSFTAAAYLQVGSNGTIAKITAEFRNSGGTVLLSNNVQEDVSDFAVWKYKSFSAIAPAGTRTIRFIMSTGGFDLAMFDDVVLQPGGTLPLQFVSFTGQAVHNTVDLNWHTENEINTRNFQIERSADGSVYNAIGSINADQASATDHHYDFIDKSPAKGINYYRIRQNDHDGRYKYSTVIKVVYTADNNCSIYNNAAAGYIQVAFTVLPKNTLVLLYDVAGRMVHTEQVSNNNTLINTVAFSNGIYTVVIKNDQGIMDNKKIFIQH